MEVLRPPSAFSLGVAACCPPLYADSCSPDGVIAFEGNLFRPPAPSAGQNYPFVSMGDIGAPLADSPGGYAGNGYYDNSYHGRLRSNEPV